ncbi:MAG TPA: chemotaxis protein CheB [Flavobacterium sp.]|nr:chemotaxis protein CheB [Flavobacterium sp.]
MEETTVTHPCRLLVIGGSAGSLDILLQIVPKLEPVSFPIVIVLHRRNSEDLALEELMEIKSALPVAEVEDKTRLLPGHVYLAPADYHLLFEKSGFLSLDDSERIHFSRPSIDVSFESAADAYGPTVVGLLLSGANADGSKGLEAIRKAGGHTVAQDPVTAEVPLMPRMAIEAGWVETIVRNENLVDYIHQLDSGVL